MIHRAYNYYLGYGSIDTVALSVLDNIDPSILHTDTEAGDVSVLFRLSRVAKHNGWQIGDAQPPRRDGCHTVAVVLKLLFRGLRPADLSHLTNLRCVCTQR